MTMTTSGTTMTKSAPERAKPRQPSQQRKRARATQWQVGILIVILASYLGLFGLLARLDAWRERAKQNPDTNTDQISDARVWVASEGWPQGAITPLPLQMPILPPLRITPQPLSRVSPPPLRLTGGETDRGPSTLTQPGDPATGFVPMPDTVPALTDLPPVQIQPLPTLPPLPPVAAPAPVGRSRGS